MDPSRQTNQIEINLNQQEQKSKEESSEQQNIDDIKTSNRSSLKHKSHTKGNENDLNALPLIQLTQFSFDNNTNEETTTSFLIDSKNDFDKNKDDSNYCSTTQNNNLNAQQNESMKSKTSEHEKLETKSSIDIQVEGNTQARYNENDSCNIDKNSVHLKSQLMTNNIANSEDDITSNFSNRIDFIRINSPIIAKNSQTQRHNFNDLNNKNNSNNKNTHENCFKMNSTRKSMNDCNKNNEKEKIANQTEMNSFDDNIDDYNEFSHLRPRKKSSKKLESQTKTPTSNGSLADKKLLETQLDDPIQSAHPSNIYQFDSNAKPEIRVTSSVIGSASSICHDSLYHATQPCQMCANLQTSRPNPANAQTLSSAGISAGHQHAHQTYAGRHSLDHYNSRLNAPCHHHQHHQSHSDKNQHGPHQRQSVPLLCRTQLCQNHVLTSNHNIISECECENFSIDKDDVPVFGVDNGQINSDAEPKATYSYLKSYFVSMLQPSDNKLAMKLFGSKKGVLKEKLRQQEVGHWIIHPCSNFR